MPNIIEKADLGSSELQIYASLKNRQLKREGIFICEGITSIESALDVGIKPVSLLMEKRHALGKATGLIERIGEVPVYCPSDEDISRLTGIEFSRGVLCAMERPKEPALEDILASADSLAVIEDVRDESNIGSIMRNAAALGIDALVFTQGCSDPLSRKSVRVSTGAAFKLPFCHISALDKDEARTIKSQGFTLCALSLGDDSIDISEFKAQKACFVLGNEGLGIRRETLEICDVSAIIPMSRGVDSLNVATAAAIAFFCHKNNLK